MINIAEGADKFALEAFTRAIALDRANPSLRVEYGSLLSQLASSPKNASDKATLISSAKNELQIAIQLKSDYANGYYNLAKLYESTADYSSAVAAMQQAVNYLDDTTSEYAKAMSELDALKSKLPSTPSTTPTPPVDSTQDAQPQLSEPSPLPSPLPGGPIEVK
jgi:predicted Zn-dependent protease